MTYKTVLSMKYIPVAYLLLALPSVTGCVPPNGSEGPRPVTRIEWIDLHVMPTAVNLDDVPGPDGLRAQVFLYQLARPEPVTVDGTLEMLLYEGNIPAASLDKHEPFHVWRFDAAELRGMLIRKLGLWGYSMELRWGRRAPTAAAVTLEARYSRPGGKTIHSVPSAIPLGTR